MQTTWHPGMTSERETPSGISSSTIQSIHCQSGLFDTGFAGGLSVLDLNRPLVKSKETPDEDMDAIDMIKAETNNHLESNPLFQYLLCDDVPVNAIAEGTNQNDLLQEIFADVGLYLIDKSDEDSTQELDRLTPEEVEDSSLLHNLNLEMLNASHLELDVDDLFIESPESSLTSCIVENSDHDHYTVKVPRPEQNKQEHTQFSFSSIDTASLHLSCSTSSSPPPTPASASSTSTGAESSPGGRSKQPYAVRRMKNNIASRRSRQNRKQRCNNLQTEAERLTQRNTDLEDRINELQTLADTMKNILFNRMIE